MGKILELFRPSDYAASSYTIDYEALYRQGIRGLIYDVDNTLVPHGAPAQERTVELFGRLHRMGFHTCLLSNNDRARVEPFAKRVGSDFRFHAHKPMPKACREAMTAMGTAPRSTVLIGDQLFTDILCARFSGIRSILVSPIDPKEEIQIVLKRIPEKWILKRLRKEKETTEKQKNS